MGDGGGAPQGLRNGSGGGAPWATEQDEVLCEAGGGGDRIVAGLGTGESLISF